MSYIILSQIALVAALLVSVYFAYSVIMKSIFSDFGSSVSHTSEKEVVSAYATCSVNVRDNNRLRAYFKGLDAQVASTLGKDIVKEEEWTIVDNGSFRGAIHLNNRKEN
jgi:hypothetical protein